MTITKNSRRRSNKIHGCVLFGGKMAKNYWLKRSQNRREMEDKLKKIKKLIEVIGKELDEKRAKK